MIGDWVDGWDENSFYVMCKPIVDGCDTGGAEQNGNVFT